MNRPPLPLAVLEAIAKIEEQTKGLLKGLRTGFFLNERKVTAILRACGIAILKERAAYYKSVRSDNSLLWLEWLAQDIDLATVETCGTLDLLDLDGSAASRVETKIHRTLREETLSLLEAEEKGRKGDSPDQTHSTRGDQEGQAAERAARRQEVVMPILAKKRWTRSRLAAEAAVGKNSVNRYLDGTRASITAQNRKAIAEALDLQPDQLPD